MSLPAISPDAERALHVMDAAPRVDRQRAEAAISELLHALGRDAAADPLVDTPRRVVAGLVEMLAPREFVMTTFPNDEDYSDLVLVRGIPFTSLCEHHLLPFQGPPRRLSARRPPRRALEARPYRRLVRTRSAGPGAAHRPDRGSPRASSAARRARRRSRAPSICACRCAGRSRSARRRRRPCSAGGFDRRPYDAAIRRPRNLIESEERT